MDQTHLDHVCQLLPVMDILLLPEIAFNAQDKQGQKQQLSHRIHSALEGKEKSQFQVVPRYPSAIFSSGFIHRPGAPSEVSASQRLISGAREPLFCWHALRVPPGPLGAERTQPVTLLSLMKVHPVA